MQIVKKGEGVFFHELNIKCIKYVHVKNFFSDVQYKVYNLIFL